MMGTDQPRSSYDEGFRAGERFGRSEPIPMLLPCPACGERHIDEGEFVTKPHHTHACQNCGMVWRPAIVHTFGVRFLPGFKNAPELPGEGEGKP